MTRLRAFIHRAYEWLGREASSGLAGLIVAVTFGLDLVVKLLFGASSVTVLLLVVPIVVLALNSGLRGGLVGGLLAAGAAILWAAPDSDLDVSATIIRSCAFVGVGALLGWCVDERSFFERRLSRHHQLSLDLFSAAGPDGVLRDANPAWEKVLGHDLTEIASRPFLELVHPDDREATVAEFARLTSEQTDVKGFRNRYRCADGSYRWLEWWGTSIPEDGYVYSTARDVTRQIEIEEALERQSELLAERVAERTVELQRTRLDTIQRIAVVAEYRDDDTFQHTERVGRNCALLARALGLTDTSVALIRRAAPLHDIGKVGIPDAILHKRERLSPQEVEVMQTHIEIGGRILADSDFPVFQLGAVIAETHHERWDGGGYPDGLRGEQIPLAGRIAAIADAFDAMTNDRPYRAAISPAAALEELKRNRGTQFDPRLVAIWAQADLERLVLTAGEFDVEVDFTLLAGDVPEELVRRSDEEPRDPPGR